MIDKRKVAVLGGGAWGSALASILSVQGHQVRVLVRRAELADQLQAGWSPMIDLSITAPSVASTDPSLVLEDAEAVLVVMPVAATEMVADLLKSDLPEQVPVAWAAKGLIPENNALIPEYAARVLPHPSVMLSGPSFADEVAQGKPAALVSAATGLTAASQISALFHGSTIRVYTSDDPLGVAVGGAVKNVIAIAAGVITGLEFGDNARAAVVTRGLAEAARFALKLGGKRETLFGLAGLGDMMLTCGGPHSRNFAFGLALGKGKELPDKLAEGARSASVMLRRAKDEGIEMPITAAVANAIGGADIRGEITRLLARPVDSEWARNDT
ncbi:NAD(P)H-dependent glycerol-3-phosphate dehydrogenase [Alphaproteobacteria bacterium LSUCC0684]